MNMGELRSQNWISFDLLVGFSPAKSSMCKAALKLNNSMRKVLLFQALPVCFISMPSDLPFYYCRIILSIYESVLSFSSSRVTITITSMPDAGLPITNRSVQRQRWDFCISMCCYGRECICHTSLVPFRWVEESTWPFNLLTLRHCLLPSCIWIFIFIDY